MSTLDSHNDGSRTQSNPAQACAGFFCQVEVRHLVEYVAHFYHPRLSAATRGQWPSLLAGRTSERYARIAEQQDPIHGSALSWPWLTLGVGKRHSNWSSCWSRV